MADMWLWPSIQTRFGTVPCLASHAATTSAAAVWNRSGSRSATAKQQRNARLDQAGQRRVHLVGYAVVRVRRRAEAAGRAV